VSLKLPAELALTTHEKDHYNLLAINALLPSSVALLTSFSLSQESTLRFAGLCLHRLTDQDHLLLRSYASCCFLVEDQLHYNLKAFSLTVAEGCSHSSSVSESFRQASLHLQTCLCRMHPHHRMACDLQE
jgi:hypothetical protein